MDETFAKCLVINCDGTLVQQSKIFGDMHIILLEHGFFQKIDSSISAYKTIKYTM